MTEKKLRVRIGPDKHNLVLADVNNEDDPHFIDSPFFTGHIVVRIKDFHGITPGNFPCKQADKYFQGKKRMFAVQVSGRFKHEHVTDDVLFGGDFDAKVNPPTGFWVAMKFANLIDPALQSDLYCEKPWLFSPILCSMNTVNTVKASTAVKNAAPLKNITTDKGKESREIDPDWKADPKTFISGRSSKVNIVPSPSEQVGKWIWKDENALQESNAFLNPDPSKPSFPENGIFAPFIDLNTFDLALGININLIKYMNGQPIRLVAKSQQLDIPFFAIEFALMEQDGRLVSDLNLTEEQRQELLNYESNLDDQIKEAESELQQMKIN